LTSTANDGINVTYIPDPVLRDRNLPDLKNLDENWKRDDARKGGL